MVQCFLKEIINKHSASFLSFWIIQTGLRGRVRDIGINMRKMLRATVQELSSLATSGIFYPIREEAGQSEFVC